MTFDEFFSEFTLTPDERTKLVWHLAMFRARRTVEALSHASMGKPPAVEEQNAMGHDRRAGVVLRERGTTGEP